MARKPIDIPEPDLLRMVDLIARTRLSETSIREMIRKGRFPRPVYPVGGVACWTRESYDAWLEAIKFLPAIGGRRKSKESRAAGEAARGKKREKTPRTTAPGSA